MDLDAGTQGGIFNHWWNSCVHLSDGNSNVHFREEMSELDESGGDIPKGHESLNDCRG